MKAAGFLISLWCNDDDSNGRDWSRAATPIPRIKGLVHRQAHMEPANDCRLTANPSYSITDWLFLGPKVGDFRASVTSHKRPP